jgi:hypothetical protein
MNRTRLRTLSIAALAACLLLATAWALPAGAAPRTAEPAPWAQPLAWFGGLIEAIFGAEGDLGPGMDPNGLQAGGGDLGPDMDPNGLVAAGSTLGPGMDPDGLADGDGELGPDMDPDG